MDCRLLQMGCFKWQAETLTIGGDVATGKYGIDNGRDFIGNGGTINIARSDWSGIKNRDGAEFDNLSSTINIGSVSAVGNGINNSGEIMNKKTINIQRANNDGILNTSSGEITNEASGNISIGTTSAVGEKRY